MPLIDDHPLRDHPLFTAPCTTTRCATTMPHQQVVFLIGAPCSGKGTQGVILTQNLPHFEHVSTGDAFRAAVAANTEFGQLIAPYLRANRYVPDDLVVRFVKNLLASRPDTSFIFDGFPRTVPETEAILRLVPASQVLLLSSNDPTYDIKLTRRASGRVIHAKQNPDGSVSRVSYHTTYFPPPPGCSTVQRSCDSDRTAFGVRLGTFKRFIGDVVEVFHQHDVPITTINPIQPMDAVAAEIAAVFRTVHHAKTVGEVKFPDSVRCPITQEPMTDPVVCPEGHSFERVAIETWLSTNSTNPLTRTPLTIGQLSPNRSLREMIPFIVAQCKETAAAEQRAASAAAAASDVPALPAAAGGGGTAPSASAGASAGAVDWDDTVTMGAGDNPIQEGMERGAAAHHDALPEVRILSCPIQDPASLDRTVTVHITPPAGVKSAPVDVCVVVDVSTSMDTVVDGDGNPANDGLSVLDLVRHCIGTVARQLNPQDRISIVTFGSVATTVLPPTAVTPANLIDIQTEINQLRTHGATNIWGGMFTALELVRTTTTGDSDGDGAVQQRGKAIMFLTDGQPSRQFIPPNGIVNEFRGYLDKHPDFSFQLHTFGFGYNLDSALLRDIAVVGNGTFAFIPNSTVVGSPFINAVANVLATYARPATVRIQLGAGMRFGHGGGGGAVPAVEHGAAAAVGHGAAAVVGGGDSSTLNFGGLPFSVESWGVQVTVGLQVGQTRTLAVPIVVDNVDVVPDVRASIEFPTELCGGAVGELRQARAELRSWAPDFLAVAAKFQMDIVGCINAVLQEHALADRRDIVREFAQRLKDVRDTIPHGNPVALNQLQALLGDVDSDVNGRAVKALSGVHRFEKWGRHFLRALCRAHQVQLCTNAMDNGLQQYSGQLFQQLKNKGETIFETLPPPRPSRPVRAAPAPATSRSLRGTARWTGAKPSAGGYSTTNMSSYLSGAGGGCFGRSAIVTTLSDGQPMNKRVDEVCAGDMVLDSSNCYVRVDICVCLKHDETKLLIKRGGLVITPSHPVLVDNKWCCASQLLGATTTPSAATVKHVYNFVLARGASPLLVGGIPCATWGHGMTAEGIQHDFYGDRDRVVKSLDELPSVNGVVQVTGKVKACATDQVLGFY
ncbi:nucleoside monophosphate kinase [bacterium]|nr:nucleoside monophosphate kinase [bacterium]